jgi:hypothetical protein
MALWFVVAAVSGAGCGRAHTLSVRQRAEHRIPKLKAMLESETSLRLKAALWGKMERRKRHEAALRRCEFIVGRIRATLGREDGK